MKIPSEISQSLQPDDDIPDFEPTCVPTDCKKDETRYFGSCVPVPTCDKKEDYVLFVNNLTTNSTTTSCENLHLGQRGDLIGGSKHCRKGYRLDSRGNCKKTIQNGGRKNVRRQISLGQINDNQKYWKKSYRFNEIIRRCERRINESL